MQLNKNNIPVMRIANTFIAMANATWLFNLSMYRFLQFQFQLL